MADVLYLIRAAKARLQVLNWPNYGLLTGYKSKSVGGDVETQQKRSQQEALIEHIVDGQQVPLGTAPNGSRFNLNLSQSTRQQKIKKPTNIKRNCADDDVVPTELIYPITMSHDREEVLRLMVSYIIIIIKQKYLIYLVRYGEYK